jgi:uncharacterized protein YjbI with pentapeptide repeats
MPKTKAKKKPNATGKLAGKKVAIVGKFGYGTWDRDRIAEMVKLEGGTVVNGEKKKPDIVVEGKGQGKSPPGASARIQKKHPGVQVMDEADIYALCTPTADELDAILRNKCPHDWSYWYSVSRRLEKTSPKLDLSGRDYRNLNLKNASLEHVNVDHCDFRGCKLEGTDFGKIRGANFDGAKIDQISEATDCTFRNADLRDSYPDAFTRCDFTGANLKDVYSGYMKATDCTFAKANLSESDLSDSTFKNCDFTGADLSDTDLSESDFPDCNFTRANLARANLSEAKFKNANLTGADLREAVLNKVVLTGATLDGADFAGANLAGVNLKGVNVSKAKNLDVRPPRPAGPNLRKLANVVKQSKKFTTKIELTLGKKENVVLEMEKSMSGRKAYFSADFDHNTPANKRSVYQHIDAPSFEQGMINLAERWFRGTPKFETITIKATRCPKKGEELEHLVHAAWCEALDVPVPTAEDLQKKREALASKRDAVRDKLLAELRGGSVGIAKWNKRDRNEQEKVGPLAGLDFSNAKLGGAELDRFDLRGTKFDGASLAKGSLWDSQLQGASFVGTTLSNARMGYAKCQGASFEGATFSRTTAYNTNFQGANLRNAVLKKADFTDTNLCGADFTGATLEEVDFDRAKFDNDTKFPTGFKVPAKLVWKGTGSRPGLKAVNAAAVGSMDFDSFFKNLDAQVEAARMQKARSMLKAEKFQLFADVTAEKLVGVVKSQTNKDLVYSCRLAADGRFCCGTQNLKPCGGLQGALCKHLLVLITGLAKAGKVDPATVYGWVCASKGHQPVLDKDGMSETFLKYKGAEAGEIDWRPTETIPEDYYAM